MPQEASAPAAGSRHSIALPVTTTSGQDPTGFLRQTVIDFTLRRWDGQVLNGLTCPGD